MTSKEFTLLSDDVGVSITEEGLLVFSFKSAAWTNVWLTKEETIAFRHWLNQLEGEGKSDLNTIPAGKRGTIRERIEHYEKSRKDGEGK